MTDTFRILCAVDGSKGAHSALELVTALPRRAGDEVVVASYPEFFLAARPGGGGALASAMRRRREATEAMVNAAVAGLRGAGAAARGVLCDGEDTVDALLRTAEREQADVVVVGSRGHGPWTSILLGSVARALAMLSPVPVLVVRGRTIAPTRVLAAVDGSAASTAALRAFARLPQSEGTEAELLHVLPEHDWARAQDDEGELLGMRASVEYDEEQRALALLDHARALVPVGVVARTRSVRGHVGERVLARAVEIGADLIVLGTRGAAGPRRPFWGSTAERVVAGAPCAVLVAPSPAEGGPNGA